jgi:hypothetical protein
VSGCILWHGALGPRGYGRHGDTLAHRLVYMECFGAASLDGLDVHHECGVRLCVNPEHLRPVTRGEHVRIHKALRTACKHGHEWTDANTYRTKEGHRLCRRCRADRMIRYRLDDLAALVTS